jgi:Lar family restriction alleviation protein
MKHQEFWDAVGRGEAAYGDKAMNEIKPCPFCGGTSVSVIKGDTFRWRKAVCNACDAKAPEVRIQTSGDGTPDQWEDEADVKAMAEWNKRAPVPLRDLSDEEIAVLWNAQQGEEASVFDCVRAIIKAAREKQQCVQS